VVNDWALEKRARGWVVVVTILAGAVPAAAQTSQSEAAEQVKARQRISMMEAVLERAVANGADNMLRQVRAVMPESPMLSGAPQVRGFRLEGYGVFFDVGVPLLRMPIMWPLRARVTDNMATQVTLEELRELVPRLNARERAQVEQLVHRLELQLELSSSRAAPRGAAGGAAVQPAGQGLAVEPVGPADADVLDDPSEAYTREVKAALVDAMLENSGPIEIELNEWFTVAARDNVPRDPLIPGDIADFSTVIFRIRGADLAAFRAGRLTLEEARARVEVREY
jgi:hypothetical protein